MHAAAALPVETRVWGSVALPRSFSYARVSRDADSLIQAIARDRDRSAFETLFQSFAPRLKNYLMRQGTPAAEAEELAQEALVTVWRKASLFDPGRASAATWIFRIARNLRLDGLRHNRHADTYRPDVTEEPDPPDTPEALQLTRQRDERVRAAVGALSPDQLQVLSLAFFQDRAHSEIAEELQLPLGTVKSRIRLALQRLRAALEFES